MTRKNAFKTISIFLFPLFILGCSTTAAIKSEKKFQFSEINKLHQGMEEEEVIKLFGKPIAVGIDEQGREYLLYQQLTMQQSIAMTPPIIPWIYASLSAVTTGFEVRVYMKDGIVQSVGYTQYRN